MNTLLRCYSNLKDILGPKYQEPYEVVEHVNKLKNYWKPEEVKVILLAESHVYTTQNEFSALVNLPNTSLNNYPNNFVKYVYCLGYGENNLLNEAIEKNPGTPQFWKIFHSCINNIEENPRFNPILKKENSKLECRIKAKIFTLETLKERGIWLLDLSVVGLYIPGQPKPTPKIQREVLNYCWESLIKEEIEKARPKHLIIIGKGVGRILEKKLSSSQLQCTTVLNQPQARLTSKEQFELYLSCSRISMRFT